MEADLPEVLGEIQGQCVYVGGLGHGSDDYHGGGLTVMRSSRFGLITVGMESYRSRS